MRDEEARIIISITQMYKFSLKAVVRWRRSKRKPDGKESNSTCAATHTRAPLILARKLINISRLRRTAFIILKWVSVLECVLWTQAAQLKMSFRVAFLFARSTTAWQSDQARERSQFP